MRNLLLAASVLLIIVISACKKKKSSQDEPIAQNPTSIAPGEPAIYGIPANNDSIYAFLRVEKIYAGATPPAGYTVYYQPSASFFINSAPLSSTNRILSLTKAKVQSVTVDDRSLSFGDLQYGYTYRNQDQNLNLNQVVWEVKDTSGIPPFRRQVLRGMPVLKNTSFFPTSLSKSQGLSINFNNFISNADSVHVMINDNAGFNMTKSVAYTNGSVHFTNADLSSADENTLGAGIFVWADNYSHNIINNKTIIFFMRTSIGSGLVDVQP